MWTGSLTADTHVKAGLRHVILAARTLRRGVGAAFDLVGVLAAIAAMAALGVVLPAAPAAAAPTGATPWYLDQLGVPAAHRVTRGAGVTVGAVVSGHPADHADLSGRVEPLVRVKTFGRVGRADDVEPLSFNATACLGLIAGGGGGALGVAPEARVQPLLGALIAKDVGPALRWLTDHGSRVIYLADLALKPDASIADGVAYALSKQVVVVVPAEFRDRIRATDRAGVVFVGGLDRDGVPPKPVTVPHHVTLRAPGIRTPDRRTPTAMLAEAGTGYTEDARFGEDEMAAALVAGVVALIRARYPDLNAASVINRLLLTARDAGAAGVDAEFGYGIVDAAAAVTADLPAVSANPLGQPPRPPRTIAGIRVTTIAIGAAVAVLVVLVPVAIGLLLRRRFNTRRPVRYRAAS